MLFTRKSRSALIAASLALLAGCSAHSPFILKNTTDVAVQSGTTLQPHTSKVLFLNSTLPETVKFEVIGQINVGKVWYGSADTVLDQMATKARALGADGVIEVVTWHQPSGFSWAAPHGTGKAVKITNKEAIDVNALGGEWR